jgi:hypothetical protein
MKTPRISNMMAGLVALMGWAAACKAVDYHVNTAQTLQTALTLAAASSVSNNIYVTNGYYSGNFNYNSSNVNDLTILAEPGVANTQITLDGGGAGSSLNIAATFTSNITVQGMTILRNSGSYELGGLRIAGADTAILVNGCLFLQPSNAYGIGLELVSGLNAIVTNCTAAGSEIPGVRTGEGIFIDDITNDVTVQNCIITVNSGGVFVAGANSVVVTDSIFTSNSLGGYLESYGGAYLNDGYVTLSGNSFTGNSGGYGGGTLSGGGAYCQGYVTLSGNTFTGNTSANGGGAYCDGTVIASSNTFTGNFTFLGYMSGYTFGGGIYCYGDAMLSNNIFTGNSATGNGVGNGLGGGAYCQGNATLSGNTFTSNSATGALGSSSVGGGADCEGGSMTVVVGNTFQSNTATYGGGLSVGAAYGAGTVNVLDNLVVKNAVSSTSGEGGGIIVGYLNILNMINNTVSGNTSAGNGGGAAYLATGTVALLNVYNNIIWGNSATFNGGDVWLIGTGQKKVFDFNDADSIYGVFDLAQTNIDLAPQFFDPVNGDYHIQSTSPCIAAGTTNAPSLPATDLDGNPRILNGTVAIGCYEFTTNLTHPADTNGAFVITLAEFNAYAAAWKTGQTWTNGPNPVPNPVPANYMTRAGYLMTNGGAYYNDGSARPVNWKLAP